MMKLNIKNGNWIFVLLLICVYLQISFCTAALKWDLLDVVFPFRYYFSASVLSGYFPLWNPYIQTGVPFYADLQAPTYYPELLVVTSLGGYSIYWMHFLVIAYLIVGFFGVFRLIKMFNYSAWTASLVSFIYVCSGYFVGHGQHFFLLVGSAWLPWVIGSYFNFIDSRNRKTAIIFSLTTFLMLTGGYQALSICLFYLLLILFLMKMYGILKEKRKELKGFLIWHAGVFVILVLMLSPMLLAIWEISPQVARLANGVSWEKAATYGENFKSLISFFSPLATSRTNDFFGNIDASMLNHFVGVCGLFFGFYGWKSKRLNREWVIFIFGLIIGSMTFASLPIREFMFDNVPFMNLFLQGPYLRIFMILGIVIFIAAGIEKVHQQKSVSWKEILFPFCIFALIISLIAISWASFDFRNFFNDWLNAKDWQDGWKKFDFQKLLGFQLFLSFIFLSLLVFLLLISNKLKRLKLWISSLIILELFLASQWNQSETFVDRNYKPSYLQNTIQLAPQGFPIPHLTPIGKNDEQHAFSSPFWRNTYIFQKEISFHAFSSFELNNYSYLDDKEPQLKDWILKKPLIFLSDSVIPLSELNRALKNENLKHNVVFVETNEFNKLSLLNFKSDSLDNLKITGFSPNEMTFQTRTKNQQLLIFQQSCQPQWKAYIDGKSTEILRVNKNYQAVLLPSGEHKIEFKFEKNSTIVLYFISQFIFWSLLIYLVYMNFKDEKKSKWYIKSLFLLPVVFISFWSIKLFNGKLNNRTTNQQVLADWEKISIGKKVVLPTSINISKKDEFYNWGKWKFSELNNAKTLRLLSDCKMDTIQPSLLVYEVIRKGKSVKWEALKIERQLEKAGELNSLLFMRNLSDLKNEDEIILYCWNISKSEIEFKNTRVEFLR